MENRSFIWLGKFVFGGSLIMATLLVTVANVFDWAVGIDIFWGKLFQVCGDFLNSYPTLLFPLVSIFFFLLIGLIAGTSVNVEKMEEKKPRKGESFFFFYLCCFTLLSLLVFLFSMFFFNPFTAYFSLTHDLIQGESIIYAGIVITALLQAALVSSIISLWKTNAGVGILLSFIWLFFLSMTVLPGMILSDYVNPHESACKKGNNDDYRMPVPVEAIEEAHPVEEDTVENYEYYDGGEYEYDDSPFCGGMWDDPESCIPRVKLALVFADNWKQYSGSATWEFFNDPIWNHELLPEYAEYDHDWKGKKGGYAGYYNFHKAINFFKNEPFYLTRFFELYEQTIYKTISQRRYKESGASRLIPLFIAAYKDLYRDGVKDGREKSLTIYTEMSTGEERAIWDGSGHFEFITQFATQEALDKFHYVDEQQIDKDLVVWIYSFWARRENEGSAQTVYGILQKIVNHYR